MTGFHEVRFPEDIARQILDPSERTRAALLSRWLREPPGDPVTARGALTPRGSMRERFDGPVTIRRFSD